MESIHTVNEIEWINNHLQSNGLIDMEQVQCISSFSLLWNLFEGHVCGQNASIRNFENMEIIGTDTIKYFPISIECNLNPLDNCRWFMNYRRK